MFEFEIPCRLNGSVYTWWRPKSITVETLWKVNILRVNSINSYRTVVPKYFSLGRIFGIKICSPLTNFHVIKCTFKLKKNNRRIRIKGYSRGFEVWTLSMITVTSKYADPACYLLNTWYNAHITMIKPFHNYL